MPDPIDFDGGLDEAANAFADLWTKDAPGEPSGQDDNKKKPAKDAGEDDQLRSDDEPAKQEDDQSDPEGQDEDAPEGKDVEDESEDADEDSDEPKFVESDDVFVKVKVGDKEHNASIRDLKRLFGQEASLTRKSQEVAAARKIIDEQARVHVTALDAMVKRARERFEPFRTADWASAARTLEPEVFEQARAAAQAAHADVAYFEQELAGVVDKARKDAANAHKTAAQACIKALSDPDGGIEGWNEKVYKEHCAFAIEQGLAAEVVDNLTDPAAFKLINMAMQFSRGKAKVKTAVDEKVKAKKNAPPKKIVKGSAAPVQKTVSSKKADAALAKLKRTGTRDDAADAFAARMMGDSDED